MRGVSSAVSELLRNARLGETQIGLLRVCLVPKCCARSGRSGIEAASTDSNHCSNVPTAPLHMRLDRC